MLPKLRSLLVCTVALLAAATTHAQNTIHVPKDQPTIQAGINAANTGDTVLVAPGTYYENIDFLGKAITVTSSACSAANPSPTCNAKTIIDGGGTAPTVTFQSGELRTSIISNLTIRNGGDAGFTSDYAGGGIYVTNAAPTILDNIITANISHAIQVEFGAALIQGNELSGTLGTGQAFFDGSGIVLSGNSYLTGYTNSVVIGNTIENNLNAHSYDGGGIALWAVEGTVIESNIIRNNATSGVGGGIISYNTDAMTIVGNLIYGNQAQSVGGIALEPPEDTIGPFIGIVASNTIYGNTQTSLEGGPYGDSPPSQAYLDGNLGQFVMVNNIIVGSGSSATAVSCGTIYNYLSITPLVFDHNDVYNPDGAAFGGACPSQTDTYGNISADPQFSNPSASDFTLRSGSPAIDAGNNSAPLLLSTDIAGSPRIQDGKGKGYPVVDMGAYEFAGAQDASPTILTLTPSEYFYPPSYGTPSTQPLTFTVTLASAAGTPAGPVTLYEDSTVVTTLLVDSSGTAIYAPTKLASGLHAFIATYQGADSFPPAVSVKFYLIVPDVPAASTTTTTLTSSLNPSTYGQSVTFKATVSATTTPTGSITFTDGTTTLATVPLDASGNASFTTSFLTANDPGTTPNHPITAAYNPTGSFAASGASLSQVVNGLPTTNTLTISPSSGTTSTTYTLTATLKSASSVSSAVPTGTVTFYISPTNGDPGIQIGTATLTNGVATLTSSSLPVSSGFVYELYPGDTVYANSTSNSVNVNITAATAPTTTTTLAITAAGSPVTAVPTGTVVTLTATTLAGAAPVTPGQVNFCDATAPLCTDIHLLGTAQLTSAGTATLKFIPGPGTHSYKAVFLGTQTNTTSASPAEPLTVGSSGSNATTTTLSATGTPGNYTLSAVVSGSLSAPPTGTVSFLDTTNANYVLGTATLTPNAGGLTLFNSSTNPANIGPLGIVTADFNGDGIPDIATSGCSEATIDAPGSITILLGKGDGSFFQAPTITTPPYPYYLVVGDFNNDGIPDLAFTSTQTPTVTIVLGKGDGTFSPGFTTSLGLGSGALAVGDFNGDGYADLAILTETNYGSSQVLSILLGNGDGTFTETPTQLPIALQTINIKVGDFNLDGKLDLAITDGIDAPGDSGSVFLLLGNGDGTFTPAPTLTTASHPSSLAIADLNGDGKPDIAVVDDLSGTLSIFLGKGDGTFSPPTQPSAGFAPGAVSAADLNHDGKVDLVITPNLAGDGNILLLLGNGDGTFSTITGPLTGTNPWSNAVADFNGDGLDDVAVSESFTNQVNVYLTQLGGSSATATVTNISPVGTGPHLVDANYPGDSTYATSLSNTVSLTAQRVPTTLTLTATAAPSGSPITLTAAISPNTAQNHSAGGTVTFYNNGVSLSTGNGSTVSNGVANLAVTSLPIGSNNLTAQYSGDTNFAPSSGTGSITIGQSTPPDFTFIGPPTITFRTETTGVATLSLASLNGFAAPIAITCNAPLPPNYLCTLSSSTVTLAANNTASLTLTLHPNISASLTSDPKPSPSKSGLPVALASLLPLTLLALFRRKRRNPLHSLLLLLCLAAVTTALTACGSDIYYAATPPGLYPITVTATGTNQGSSTPTTHTLLLNANITP